MRKGLEKTFAVLTGLLMGGMVLGVGLLGQLWIAFTCLGIIVVLILIANFGTNMPLLNRIMRGTHNKMEEE